MNVAKDSFILYTEQKEVIDKLNDEQAGKLIKAIYEYVETGKMPKLDIILDLVIIPFKQNIDRNADKYEETKKKRSEAGKLGAEIKKQKQAKQANAKFANNKQANQAVNVNVNDNVNVNENALALYDVDVEKINNAFLETLGSTNLNNIKECTEYLKELPFEVIEHALKITARKGAKWDYAMTILDNYVDKKLNTLEKVQADEIEFKNRTNKNPENEETEQEKIARKTKALEEAMKNANW